MSAIISHASAPIAMNDPAPRSVMRFGTEAMLGAEGLSAQWLLKRNCSITPRQTLAFYGSLCLFSLAIAAFFWFQGASLVLPFATLEIAAVGTAVLLFARHATDSETIRLQAGCLMVEHVVGGHTRRAEFAPAWVRVEPEHGTGSLVEISGQGQRISVGRFVRPELRRQLADELRGALRRWQGFAWRAEPMAAAPHDHPIEH